MISPTLEITLLQNDDALFVDRYHSAARFLGAVAPPDLLPHVAPAVPVMENFPGLLNLY